MGKIFTIEFKSLNNRHNALVSVYGENPCIHVQFIDSYLKNIFSTEHIRYKGNSGFKKLPQYQHPSTKEIIEKIAVAIEKELYKNYATIKRLFPSLYWK